MSAGSSTLFGPIGDHMKSPVPGGSRRRVLECGLAALLASPWRTSNASSPLQGKSYARVTPRPLAFPRDHGGHPDYRTEWWYLTGWLRTTMGRAIGFQLTFFRSRTVHPDANPSRFAPRQLLFSHAALSIDGTQRVIHADQVARTGFADAVFSETDTALTLNRWALDRQSIGNPAIDHYRGLIAAADWRLSFQARTDRPPVLRGNAGLSAKGPGKEQASHYYSRPHLNVVASLGLSKALLGRVGQQGIADLATEQSLTGQAWLDHEWSSSLLMEGAVGWDWLGLHLDSGESWMLFRIRDGQGKALFTETDRRDHRGRRRAESRAARWEVIRHWQSPHSGAHYPVEIRLHLGDESVQIQPMMDDQEIDARASTGGFYWEGAVRVIRDAKEVGRGYLELTGYARPLAL